LVNCPKCGGLLEHTGHCAYYIWFRCADCHHVVRIDK